MGEDLVNIILDGRKIEVKNGERLVEIIRRHNPQFPSPCYHSELTETGHCRMCLVGARRKPKDPFTVVYSCTATAKDGMEIDTEYRDAVTTRNEFISLCSLQHPLDCSKCDKVGTCFLQKFSIQSKLPRFTRVVKGKLEGVAYEDFGNGIAFDRQRCIGCQRCVRFCRDILGEEILGFARGDKGFSAIHLYPGKTLEGNYSMNIVDLCPAGALTNRNCVHQPAAWVLSRTMSISAESSVGVNTYVLHKKNKIFRIVPRENVHVNGLWMPDSARTEHGQCSCEKRLVKITQNGRRISIGAAISQIIKSALGNKLFVVCSGNMSLEDQFVLRRLLDVIVSTTFLLKKSIRGDGFLISDDGTPNFNGATLNSITANENIVNDLLTLDRAIKGRECKKILAINEDIFANGVSVNAASGVDIFYIGTEMNATAKAASVIIPMATFFEYTGTFINRDWRLQKFHKAVNPPNANIFPLWYIFSLLLNSYIGTKSDTMLWLDGVWQEMSKTIQALESIDFLNINPAGIELKFR